MSRHRTAICLLVLAAACASGERSVAETPGASVSDAASKIQWDPMLAEMGQEGFAYYCTSCHGEDARGNGPVARALMKPPADLTRIAARRGGNFPTGEISRMIDGRFEVTAHGTREMPVWGETLSAAVPEPGIGEEIARGTIATIVEYLKSIQRD